MRKDEYRKDEYMVYDYDVCSNVRARRMPKDVGCKDRRTLRQQQV